MTFKHTKFDSPTLRALEKIAVEKGLVKPEPLEKKAAVTKKADYTPTPSLMENIFKLCAGLRDNGLKKEADEIEMNYLNLKRAQTLYETSKETGDDLVHDAHPKGSHKLEGVEGDEATIEDILDQHLKIVEVVNKKPTGKLSNASILNSVKKVLAQGTTTIPEVTVVGHATPQTEEEWNAELSRQTNVIQKFVSSTISKIKEHGNLDEYTKSNLDSVGKEFRLALSERPFTANSFRECQVVLKKLQSFAEEGDFASHWYQSQDSDDKGVSLWNTYVAPHITPIISGLNKLLPISKNLDDIRIAKEQGTYKEPVKQQVSPAKNQLASRIKVLLANIARGRDLYPQRVPANRHAQVKTALDNWEKAAQSETAFMGRISDEELESQKDKIAARVTSLENWVNEFMTKWLGER